jgi:hypothetical protein
MDMELVGCVAIGCVAVKRMFVGGNHLLVG